MTSFASSPARAASTDQKNSSTNKMRKEKAAGGAGQPWVRPSFEKTHIVLPSSLRTKLSEVRERMLAERACKVRGQVANVGQNHHAVRVAECRATVELSHCSIAFCFDRRLVVSRERFQCCLPSDGVLRRSEYLCEIRCFGSDKCAVGDSAKSRRTAQGW